MLVVALGVMGSVQVWSADIAIERTRDRAVVASVYVVSAAENQTVGFDAISLPGQALTLEGFGEPVERKAGLTRVVASVANERDTIRVNYVVTGPVERVPLFVPDVATVPGRSEITIRVDGLAPGARLSDAFPRMEQETPTVGVGHPANIPSFVYVPRPGPLSRARVADGCVIAVLLLASLFWWRRTFGRAT